MAADAPHWLDDNLKQRKRLARRVLTEALIALDDSSYDTALGLTLVATVHLGYLGDPQTTIAICRQEKAVSRKTGP